VARGRPRRPTAFVRKETNRSRRRLLELQSEEAEGRAEQWADREDIPADVLDWKENGYPVVHYPECPEGCCS